MIFLSLLVLIISLGVGAEIYGAAEGAAAQSELYPAEQDLKEMPDNLRFFESEQTEKVGFTLYELYSVLGISNNRTNCNVSVIKKAYKDLARIHHPDKGGDQQRFKAIGIAHRILTDTTERATYNRLLSDYEKTHGHAPNHNQAAAARAAAAPKNVPYRNPQEQQPRHGPEPAMEAVFDELLAKVSQLLNNLNTMQAYIQQRLQNTQSVRTEQVRLLLLLQHASPQVIREHQFATNLLAWYREASNRFHIRHNALENAMMAYYDITKKLSEHLDLAAMQLARDCTEKYGQAFWQDPALRTPWGPNPGSTSREEYVSHFADTAPLNSHASDLLDPKPCTPWTVFGSLFRHLRGNRT